MEGNNPFLYADIIRFGYEEAVRMAALDGARTDSAPFEDGDYSTGTVEDYDGDWFNDDECECFGCTTPLR